MLKFPSDEDLNGAAVALTRLQDTYKLDTASVARGELNGVQYSTELSGEHLVIVYHHIFLKIYYAGNIPVRFLTWKNFQSI